MQGNQVKKISYDNLIVSIISPITCLAPDSELSIIPYIIPTNEKIYFYDLKTN